MRYAGAGEAIEESDLYPGARLALAALRASAAWGADNQTEKAARLLRTGASSRCVATSGECGVAKSEPASSSERAFRCRASPTRSFTSVTTGTTTSCPHGPPGYGPSCCAADCGLPVGI